MSATGRDCLLLRASAAGMCAQAGLVGGSLQINALNVNQTMAQHVHCGPRLHKHTPAFVHVGTNPPDADEAAKTPTPAALSCLPTGAKGADLP